MARDPGRGQCQTGSLTGPCYWWYYHHYGIDSPLDSFNDVYHETIRELASSSDSSGGGGGGGFSGGGGGGVGGGGGGTF